MLCVQLCLILCDPMDCSPPWFHITSTGKEKSSKVLILVVAQLVKNLPAMQETWVQSLGWEDPRRRKRLSTPVFWPGESLGLQSLGPQRVRHN